MRSLKPGRIVTFQELMDIDLDDAPCLNVKINGREAPVQTSHVRDDIIIERCRAWASSKWEFEYTTHEWIPVFHFVGTDAERDALVDFKLEKPTIYNEHNPKNYWVTPKGSPREE